MRKCGFCKFLVEGTCKKGFQVEPFEKLDGYKRPKNCTKKQESATKKKQESATKKKQESDSWLNKQLDKLWSEAVRSKGYCELCGRKPPEVVLHAHHIYSRTHRSTRYDLDNSVCLCMGCHLYTAHKSVQEFSDWICEKLGSEKLDSLRKKAHTAVKYTKEEKLEMIENLKKMLYKQNEIV